MSLGRCLTGKNITTLRLCCNCKKRQKSALLRIELVSIHRLYQLAPAKLLTALFSLRSFCAQCLFSRLRSLILVAITLSSANYLSLSSVLSSLLCCMKFSPVSCCGRETMLLFCWKLLWWFEHVSSLVVEPSLIEDMIGTDCPVESSV